MFVGTYTRREAARFDLAQVTTTTAAEAYEQVLATAGASYKRDAVDLRLVEQVRSRTGRIINSQREVGGWPMLLSGSAPLDSDGDGMPDAWESARGLNPRNPAGGAIPGADGYTNLEVYLNAIAAPLP